MVVNSEINDARSKSKMLKVCDDLVKEFVNVLLMLRIKGASVIQANALKRKSEDKKGES